jgi:radical SAM superfamily enzyme YgiQ (UPF0313 family)
VDYVTPSLGIAYVASYLITRGVVSDDELHIVDSLDEALDFRPEIVGISSVSQTLGEARRFARDCKNATPCVTVLGGHHISSIPAKLPEEFDFGVIGEGEQTFAELVSCLSEQTIPDQSLSQIRGLCYRSGGTVKLTPKRELFPDIDLLPIPLRHRQYSDSFPIMTSRGCPYQCTYCASHKFWGDTVRLRSAESVVEEIEYGMEWYQPTEIYFLDDLWIAHKKRFHKIVDMLCARRIPDKVQFMGFCRSNLVYEEEILLLKKINYSILRFGGETGSEHLLQRLKGKNISLQDHQRVIDLCARHSLPCSASFMFGVPGETREDLERTVEFLHRNKGKLEISGFYLLNPIPGTPIWEELVAKGAVDDSLPFERYQIDFNNPNFSWDNILYFNHENVPLQEFQSIVESIREQFINQSLRQVLLRGLRLPVNKITVRKGYRWLRRWGEREIKRLAFRRGGAGT